MYTISDMIKDLEIIKAKNGDLEVRDYETGYAIISVFISDEDSVKRVYVDKEV